MSKSKEQCISIIGQKFDNLKNKKDYKALFIVLEETIIEITEAEVGLIWLFDKERNKIKTFLNNKEIELDLEESILKTVLESKRGFFDNYIVSHQKYNQKIDNILNIKIKSMIVVPILDKRTENVFGFISAYNSVKHPTELKRYDLRSLSLLEGCAFNVITLLKNSKNNFSNDAEIVPQLKKIVKKKEEIILLKPIEGKALQEKSKIELEEKMRLQDEKIKALEDELFLKTEELQKQKVLEAEPVIEEEYLYSHDIEVILKFLTNEVTYLANEEHKLYLFLEIIKNSLHNKEQLHFLNDILKNSKLIEKLANDLYSREKMPLLFNDFNLHQLISDIGQLYGKTLAQKNITLNIFLNSNIPDSLTSDKDKIKSLIIHLMNNIFNFTNESGAIEVNINFLEELEQLTVEIKGLKHHKVKKIKSFFTHTQTKTSYSVTSSDLGLGLSVSSNLINMLNGKLKLSTSGKDEHSFTAFIPLREVGLQNNKGAFVHKKIVNIAILMEEENLFATQNLIKQLVTLGIDKKSIVTFENFNKINSAKISHLFCFENMLFDDLKLEKFSSITVLKYSNLEIIQNKKNLWNELYVNSYYGLELQKIFFPDKKVLEMEGNTLLVEDSFLTKFNNVVKRLKFS